ncbi:AAA family ATPase [Streptomyces fimicarius]|uniref:AAA family ATPase n=1 Tax=Streptomyces griseus TaxID=1911 RepID=UPI0036C1EEEB
MATKTSAAPALDWGWHPSPATSAALVAGGAYTVAATGAVTGLPPTHALLIAGTGAVAQTVVDAYQRRPHGHTFARCAAWLAAGGWTAAALADHTPLTWGMTGWWAAGAAAGITLARGLVQAEDTARTEHHQRKLQKWANKQAGDWHDRLHRLFRLEGHQVDGVRPWEGGVGYTVLVTMPSDTPELPADAVRKLAVDLRLPKGGGIQILDGETYGQTLIRVTAVDVLAKQIDLPDTPDDTTVTSVHDGIPLGLKPDADQARIVVVDECALIVGQTGSGKTNTVNVANAGALRTNDTVVMHIDVTGAGISLPWLHAWATDGNATVPLIDWTADTIEEAHILCDTVIAGIGARKSGHQDKLVDDDKLTVSHDLPEVLVLVDEIAELTPALLRKLDTMVNTGRAARVRVLICGLRATQDVITAAMKKQSRVRVGMRVSDPEELSHLFPSGGARINPKSAPYKGCGFYSSPDADDVVSDPTAFKAYRITPKQIRALSVTYAERRPKLEDVFLDTEPGQYYASRWGRILPRIYRGQQLAPTTHPYTDMEILHPPIDEFTGIPNTGFVDDDADGTAGPRAVRSSTTPAATATAEAPPKRFGSDLLSDMLAAARTIDGRHDQASTEADATVIEADFGRVIRQAGAPQDRPNPVPQLLTDAHQHIVAAGGRIHTGDLATRMGTDPVALGTELNRLLRAVGIERPGKGSVRAGTDGESKAGYLAETLAAAIHAYATRDAQ